MKDLMGKFENLESNKSNDSAMLEALKAQIKGIAEKSEREFKELKESVAEISGRTEKQVKTLDKTFSFQENGNGVTRRDFDELERKITAKIEENFHKTNAVC